MRIIIAAALGNIGRHNNTPAAVGELGSKIAVEESSFEEHGELGSKIAVEESSFEEQIWTIGY